MTKAAARAKKDKFDVFVRRVSSNNPIKIESDTLAVEEPLEIRLAFTENGKFQHKAVSITMRTPGNDFELAAGFLFTEGVISSRNEISDIKYCGKSGQTTNTVRVDLEPRIKIDFK
jgi:FdhD protein